MEESCPSLGCQTANGGKLLPSQPHSAGQPAPEPVLTEAGQQGQGSQPIPGHFSRTNPGLATSVLFPHCLILC